MKKFLQAVQNTIGYHFDNEDLLQQAFIRRSFSEEKGGQNNEVLEFIGDKALDLVVIKLMMEEFGQITEEKDYMEFKLRNPKYFKTKYQEGKFTDIKKDLVEKHTLSECMDRLGFHEYLFMGKGDIKNNIQNQDSVKEDLFEAIIGAVAIDSDWDLEVLSEVVSTMIDFDAYFSNIDDSDGNFVGKLQEWFQMEEYGIPNYEYIETFDKFVCLLNIHQIGKSFKGHGSSQAKARMDVAKTAYIWLKENDYIPNPYEEAVGEPIYEDAIRQINELVQKRLISNLNYVFNQKHDNNGNSYWTCIMSIDEVEEHIESTFDTKKEAQRDCCYEMLNTLMYEI